MYDLLLLVLLHALHSSRPARAWTIFYEVSNI